MILKLPLGMRIFNFVNFESLIYMKLYSLLILYSKINFQPQIGLKLISTALYLYATLPYSTPPSLKHPYATLPESTSDPKHPPFKHLHASLPKFTPPSQNIPSFKHPYAMVGHSGIQTFLAENILPFLTSILLPPRIYPQPFYTM